MASNDEKQRRKALLAQVKQAQSAVEEAGLPLPKPVIKDLFDYVNGRLEAEGCDDTLRHSRAILGRERRRRSATSSRNSPRCLSQLNLEEGHMATERRYTLEEAAARLGFRADDLAATLPDAGIDLAAPGHDGDTLSETEVTSLSRLIERIKQFHNGLSDVQN